ncbi:hypothetical protein F441_11523 [Phytophthora nicotianae CJ01A1]|uniref:Uncharacterized protein n=2 Tax=Phytophthora nicotianae TaxID=4792 RepID=W2IRR2_PHYNI|nr:hypothetical protein L915_11292 [Phytophthora nicotianae]ETL36914.1 hypothetical protein L916_11193 [Phytophthora nicotianae]ETL90084.1 hypothetical protein L917_11097 [Phytophthora nicotianae]ETP13243.1 hypothetical protein F441_11523 [Phytophthora nicotianae CJ01A1]
MSSVDEAAVPVDILKQELPLNDSRTELVEPVIETEQHDEEPLDEFELALQKVLGTRRFEGLDDLRNTFLATTQLTTSNVVSTVVTALAVRGTRRKRSKLSTPPMAAPSSNQETRETVYGAPKSLSARSNKTRRGTSPHQAQLPTFRRSLPALSIPTKRLHRELLLERQAFMAQLTREREEKAQLECWAATRIQACFRGFRSRPRVVAYARRMKKFAMRTASSIRLDLADMQESLRISGNLPEESESSLLWRQGVKDRARRKRGFKNRQEERQSAAIRIQSCVRRFLAKIAYRHLVARARNENHLLAVVKIQSIYRGYYLRSWIERLVPTLKHDAAVQIQALVRGSQARERVSMLLFERRCEERRRAGLPFQVTLGSQTSILHRNGLNSDSSASCLRVLYENRKSRASLEFKTDKWQDERRFLRIYNISRKLAARRARLVHRWNWTKTVVLDKRRQRRVKKVISAWMASPSPANRVKSATRTAKS